MKHYITHIISTYECTFFGVEVRRQSHLVAQTGLIYDSLEKARIVANKIDKELEKIEAKINNGEIPVEEPDLFLERITNNKK